jgi:NTE family protein
MIGLVLGGGGAKGAYQIGVWKALRELNIEIGFVCGTSVGALNGAFVAQKQYDIAYEMWSKIDMDKVFDAEEDVIKGVSDIFDKGVLSTSVSFLKKAYKNIWDQKGLNIGPLREMISEYLDEEALRKSEVGFGLVTISLDDKKPLRLYKEDIALGELKYYLLGSAMVPGFTQDETFHKKFVDGGLYDNFPIKLAYDKGYRDIIGVSLFPKIIKSYKDANVTIIQPSRSLGNFLYFNKELAQRNIALGYLDAMKELGHCFGKQYFIQTNLTEEKVASIIANMTPQKKQELSNLVLGKDCDNIRIFYEKVLHKCVKDSSMNNNGSYLDLFIAIAESLLSQQKKEDLKMYTLEDILDDLLGDSLYNDYRVLLLQELKEGLQ